MNWKISLDKYLTTPHDDGFDSYCEYILSSEISDEFYNANEDWINESSGLCNKWLNKLYFKKGADVENAAKIIERAFHIFIQKI